MGRINAVDNTNNGLLLRNLFGAWPRKNLAQIFSSGDNGDAGFFGDYYRIGPKDRRLGNLFYKLKADAVRMATTDNATLNVALGFSPRCSVKTAMKHLFVDSGYYEIVFRPRLSREMISWVEGYQPDIIFSQGYCLTFALLPYLLAKRFKVAVAYYPTDDWPSEKYHTSNKNNSILAKRVAAAVADSARRLVEIAEVRLAFNRYMQEEYRRRYGCKFSVLMHGDAFSRYRAVQPKRLAETGECWIVSTGIFNRHRKPLLDDLDHACALLHENNIRVRATVFPVNPLAELSLEHNSYRHITFAPCPSHDDLVSVLKGADILFLPERFDESAQGIRLSVSSKAHLFMFSEKPIVVYSSDITGIARYARDDGWAEVVDCRDADRLARTLKKLITHEDEQKRLVAQARRTAVTNHELSTIQSTFLQLLKNAIAN
jgi:glycosyltransferase involved in cell wall biosynthesis